MKKCYLIIIIACFSITCAHATPENLVSNAGFEILDSQGMPEAWSRLPSTWSVDDEISHSGTRSLMVNIEAAIVDNLDGIFTGDWSTSSWAPGYYGDDYHYHEAGTGGDTFRWTITASGTYEVFARWTSDPSRAPDATYRVYHDDGYADVPKDQRYNGGEWIFLGTYSFDGTGDYVELKESPNGYVVADAIMIAPPYEYPGQTISCTPGKSYRVGVWIKTEDISGPGATFCVEYFDRDGKYLFGEYGAPKISGTVDWQEVVFEEVLIPERFMMKDVANYVTLSLYLSKGTTGKAWFDDVTFVENQKPLMETFLLRPNYRGMILPSAESPEIFLEVSLNPKPYGMSLEDLEIECLLRNGEQTLTEKRISRLGSNKFTLEMNLDDTLPKGKYTLTTILIQKDPQIPLAQSEHTVEKLSPEDVNTLTSYIDSYNRLIVNGQPFFPLGFYMGHDGIIHPLAIERLDKIANSPFNTVMNYGTLATLTYLPRQMAYDKIHEYLSALEDRDLKLIFCILANDSTLHHNQEAEVKDIISEFKDRPSVISWYINDELGLEWLPQLTQHYNWITETDQSHPTWSVLWRPQNLIKEVNVTDVLGVDPYPIPKLPVTYVTEMAQAAKEAGRGTRPLWIVIQAFGYSQYGRGSGGRAPTKEELRCMTYLGIIHGATGLIYYSYFDLIGLPDIEERWEWMKDIGNEIKILKPVILSTSEIPENPLSCNNGAIHFLLKKYGDEFYLIAANTSDSEIEATFKGHREIRSSSAIEEIFQGEEIPIRNNRFTDTFDPLEVRVYRWPAKKMTILIQ